MPDLLRRNALKLPRLGLGTYLLEGRACQDAVESAVALGYRHIDTAEVYGNETEVGSAIAASGVRRDDIHVTSKLWLDHNEPELLRRALDDSLARLKLDRIDLYMIHWPTPDMDLPAMLEALASERRQGRIGAIGVCNFPLSLMRMAIEQLDVPIDAVQAEYHVFLDQTPLLEYLRSRGIPLIAFGPLAQGAVTGVPELQAIADRHKASPSQVALAWLLRQEGVAAIPKAERAAHQRANLTAADIDLSIEELELIDRLPKDRRLVDPSFAPDWSA